MAQVRARAQLNVGKNSDIAAEIVSFSGLNNVEEHVALVFNQADTITILLMRGTSGQCLSF